MIFDGIRGNEDVKRALVGMVDGGRVPHAIMFYENDGCGAMLFALGLLELLMGSQKVARFTHPDVHFFFPVTKGSKVSQDKPTSESYMRYWTELVSKHPYFLESDVDEAFGIEGKSSVIAVAEARSILDMLSLGSMEGGYRAIIIYLPEKMNSETANRLLKSIEEPPEKTQFIFITHAPEKVLTTVSSRCQGFRIGPLTREQVREVLELQYGKSGEEARSAAEASGGSVGRAVLNLSQVDDEKSEAVLFRRLMQSLLDRDLMSVLDAGDAIASLPSREKAKSFCGYMGESLRRIFMLQQGMEAIAGIPSKETDIYRDFALRCRKTFARQALPYLDEAVMMIDRNVSQKILFCDLVCRLFLLV